MEFFNNPNVDFIKSRYFFFILSVISFILGIALVFISNINMGIDFVGGTELQVAFEQPINIDQIRSAIEKNGIEDSEIKTFGKDSQYLIRVKENNTNDSKVSATVMNILTKEFPGHQAKKIGENSIGPKVGKEMRTQAIIAVILAVVAIMLFVAFRFEWVYGLGAMISIVHDVVFTFGLVLFVGKLGIINVQFDQTMLAALLTVIGYSINDTVVIFDRIRENKDIHKGMEIRKLINLSMNETLSRTINTGMSVIVVLGIMVFTAGPVLQGFCFTMLIGIIVGTYSSIYVASSYVIYVVEKKLVKEQNLAIGHK